MPKFGKATWELPKEQPEEEMVLLQPNCILRRLLFVCGEGRPVHLGSIAVARRGAVLSLRRRQPGAVVAFEWCRAYDRQLRLP